MRIRKDTDVLTSQEWTRLIRAMKELKRNNGWGFFVEHHAEHAGLVHSDTMFLPFHRRFILDFEDRLRAIEPQLTLPYWNWACHPKIPKDMDRADWMDIRPRAFRIPTKHEKKVEDIVSQSTFNAMWKELEGMHNKIHVRVGGDMKDPAVSPQDPLFFLHHAFVDKIWWEWQCKHKEAGFTKPNPEEQLPHYSDLTVQNVLDIRELDYRYAP